VTNVFCFEANDPTGRLFNRQDEVSHKRSDNLSFLHHSILVFKVAGQSKLHLMDVDALRSSGTI
jgi:hypothetical protein